MSHAPTTWRAVTDLRGKTVVLTGGASGIGRATALQYASAGARVIIGDVNEAEARATVQAIQADFGQAQMARVAFAEILVELRRIHRQAGVGPGHGAADDGRDVAIAARTQGFGGELRTPAALADQQDFRIAIGEMGRRIRFELGARDAACVFRRAQRALVRVADVDQQRTGLLPCERLGGSAFVRGHGGMIARRA